MEVVEAARRRCQLGAHGLNLEGDALGGAWPGGAKRATQVRVLLLELAHLSARSIEVWTAMLGPQSDVLVEESDHLANRIRSEERGADAVHDPGLEVICSDLGTATPSQAAVVPTLPRIRARHPAAARAAQQLGEDVPAGVASDREPIRPAARKHVLDPIPELVRNDRLDVAGDDFLLRVASALSAMFALDARLSIEDLDPTVDRV